MQQGEKRVNIMLDADVIEKLKKLAVKDGRSLSEYMNMVIKEHVSVKKGERGIT